MALSRTDYTASQEEFPSLPYTTGEHTFPNGHPVVVVVNAVNEVGSENPAALFSIDDTGANLTWATRVAVDSGEAGDYMPCVVIFTAIGNGTPCTLTVTKTGSGLGRLRIQPYTWSGAHASPFGATMSQANSGNVTNGALSGTLSAAPASTSEVIASICGTCNGGNLTQITAGTGWTEDYDVHLPDYSIMQAQARTGSTSDQVTWDDVLQTGDGYYRRPVAAALEIIAAEESGGSEVTGTGALTSPAATTSGSGSRGLHDLPGPIELSSSIPTVSGTGTVDTPELSDVTGSGALQASIATTSGLGIRGITGTGACSMVMPSVRGFDVLPGGKVYQEMGFGLQMRF